MISIKLNSLTKKFAVYADVNVCYCKEGEVFGVWRTVLVNHNNRSFMWGTRTTSGDALSRVRFKKNDKVKRNWLMSKGFAYNDLTVEEIYNFFGGVLGLNVGLLMTGKNGY
jgi:hypothetical protein